MVFDVNASRIAAATLDEFLNAELSTDLKEIPGIGDAAIEKSSSSQSVDQDKEADSSAIFVVHEEDSPPIFVVDDEVEDNSSALFIVHEEQELISSDDEDEDDDKYAALSEEEEMLMKNLEDQLHELKRKKLINEMKLNKMQGQHDMDDDLLLDDEDFYFQGDPSASMNTDKGHNDTLAETYLRP